MNGYNKFTGMPEDPNAKASEEEKYRELLGDDDDDLSEEEKLALSGNVPKFELPDDPEEINRLSAEEGAPDFVGMTLKSGVAPLEMRFSQINSCYRRLPIAYRSHTFINSVTMGVITPEQYCFAADGTDRGLRLAEWNIIEAMKAIKAFTDAGRNVQFVTARCPAKLAMREDLYEWMKKLMEENSFTEPEKLCLEFPQSLLYEDKEKTRLAVLNMKLLKVKTLMSGCGAEDCPVSTLLEVPVDMVLTDRNITALVGNRNKGTAASSFISYIRSMQIDIIADGVYNDAQISQLNRADCLAYIPSSGFKGSIEHGPLRMTLSEAISQKEEEMG